MSNINLVNVFNDTFNTCQNLEVSKTSKFSFSDISPARLGTLVDNISVINSDTVSAMVSLVGSGKTCVLNMASDKRPGGGVENGASAQEESLFRCSNLWTSVDKSFYPLMIDECLYTKDAIFFKDKSYQYMTPVKSDVITIPAFNINKIGHFFGKRVAKFDELNKTLNYENNTKDKIRLMLSIPSKNGVKNLVLGAWGCGVYKNDPEKMSEYFREVLVDEGYSSLYDKVIFAIINDHNSVGNNFDIFSKKFN